MPVNRDLVEIIRMAADEMREQLHTSLPGVVQTFYADEQTADIEIMVSRPIVDPDTGLTTYETFPVLPKVPIAYPQGGGFVMAFPLSQGDEVTVVFRMYSDTDWKETGQISNPTDATAHGLYCVAMPCTTQISKQLSDPIGSDLIVGRAGHNEQIRIPKAGGEIDLGAAVTDFVALASKIDSLINVLVASYPTAGVETGFAAFATAIAAWKMANWTGGSPTTGASLVKAQ